MYSTCIKQWRFFVVEKAKRMKRKAFVAQELCVACGCCVKVCPMGAIQIMKGIMAAVDFSKCVAAASAPRNAPHR